MGQEFILQGDETSSTPAGTREDVKKQLKKLYKYFRLYNLHPRVFKELAKVVPELLILLCNKSSNMGKSQKTSKMPMCASIQMGKWDDLGSCRPGSLTLILGKVMEGLIRNAVRKVLRIAVCCLAWS